MHHSSPSATGVDSNVPGSIVTSIKTTSDSVPAKVLPTPPIEVISSVPDWARNVLLQPGDDLCTGLCGFRNKKSPAHFDTAYVKPYNAATMQPPCCMLWKCDNKFNEPVEFLVISWYTFARRIKKWCKFRPNFWSVNMNERLWIQKS